MEKCSLVRMKDEYGFMMKKKDRFQSLSLPVSSRVVDVKVVSDNELLACTSSWRVCIFMMSYWWGYLFSEC